METSIKITNFVFRTIPKLCRRVPAASRRHARHKFQSKAAYNPNSAYTIRREQGKLVLCLLYPLQGLSVVVDVEYKHCRTLSRINRSSTGSFSVLINMRVKPLLINLILATL